ncbi:hypothetical protein [uncultured Jatrophihabitans sp.]|uniref:hypothetical protein n=1 Tax=uncultured Jatrophihabitans sp. TaxID=1610747 RepID=UPI0035CAC1C3
MDRSIRPYALLALAAVVIGILENVFFGADHGGAKHDVSVAFFLLAVVGGVALVALGVLALARRVRGANVS